MLPRIVRSPVEICFGTRPSHAPKSRPLANASPVPIAATIALAMIGPMPGTLINLSQAESVRANALISFDRVSMRFIEPAPILSQSLDEVQHAWRQHVSAFGDNGGQLSTQEAWPLPYRHPTLQQEGAHLVDDAGALTDQSLAHSVQGLQVELIGGLGGDELHGRALHRFGDRLGIARVVLVSLRIRPHVFCRHQPSVVTECLQLATEMMRADA